MLEVIGDKIWGNNEPHKTLGMEIGHRMTIICLSTGELWVHSPGALGVEIKSKLSSLGPLGFLIAPSRMHDLYLKQWLETYKAVKLFTAPGVEKDHKDLRVHAVLSDLPPKTWGGEVDHIIVQGIPKLNEVIFYHKASRTVILADLAFNLGKDCSIITKMLLQLDGAYQKFTPTRLFKLFIKDRKAMRTSIDKILGWDFNRIVVGHGEIIKTGGKEALKEAYHWL